MIFFLLNFADEFEAFAKEKPEYAGMFMAYQAQKSKDATKGNGKVHSNGKIHRKVE